MAKKTIAAALGGLALAALAGSGVASADDATTTYLRNIRGQMVTGSDATLMAFGNAACRHLRMGSDLDATALAMETQFDMGPQTYDLHRHVVTMVDEARILCPETHRYPWEK